MSDETSPPPGTPAGGLDITPVTIEEELKRSFLDYSMSVIVSRALPDVRDGLKPVHRRILYAMKEGGYEAGRPYNKSARVVGDVMGKYHPHGDTAIYDALVRLAQPFSMRLTLIDGQGNFGSMDDDPPAAMRYTEARLTWAAESLLEDIKEETVDFQPNYDGKDEEPTVLPARFPNLLVNGALGIAIGMATSIPPHNLGEVVDACLALLDDPALDWQALMQIVPGPDFPTGGVILGQVGIRSAYSSGRGNLVLEGAHHVEDRGRKRESIVFTELPYALNKNAVVKRVNELAHQKDENGIAGIAEVRDESDRDGVRVVIDLKHEAQATVVLQNLLQKTPLRTSIGINMLALDRGRPRTMPLKEMLQAFLDFREEVIRRRTLFRLRKARERAHVLMGLAVAVANIDDMVALIRHAPDPASARQQMMERAWPAADVAPMIRLVDEPDRPLLEGDTYRLSEEQARAILDLRLQRLTGLEREKIAEDLRTIVAEIRDLLETLANRDKLLGILREELAAVRDRFSTPRRTRIEFNEHEVDHRDLIRREEMVVTVSTGGYIKRVPLDAFQAHRRGGKGRTGMAMKEEDAVATLFVASTHTPLLLFTSRGRVFQLDVFRLPLGTPQARGKALVNLLPLIRDDTDPSRSERITTLMPVPENEAEWEKLHIVFATSMGTVRRNRLSDFGNIRANGLIAMKLDEAAGERLVGVATCTDQDDLMLVSRAGRCVRFRIEEVRAFTGRTSTGVRGIQLRGPEDEVVSMTVLRHVEATPAERAAYMRHASQKRRESGQNVAEGTEAAGDPGGAAPEEAGEEETLADSAPALSPARIEELDRSTEVLLTVTSRGLGKRSFAYDYRVSNRGTQGILGMRLTEKAGEIVATLPVKDGGEVILVTDRGQILRTPVDEIRLCGRLSQGVILFRVKSDERVVSVAALAPEMATGGESGALETKPDGQD